MMKINRVLILGVLFYYKLIMYTKQKIIQITVLAFAISTGRIRSKNGSSV